MSTQDDNQSELQVCARLLRALAHRVRGDLSVITNDLAYIATLIDPTEVERARNRCSSISAGLASIGALSSREAKRDLPLAQALRAFNPVSVGGDREVTGTLFVAEGLVEHAATLLGELVGEWEAHVDQGSGAIALTLRPRQITQCERAYTSLGAFAGAQLGERFVVEAGLVDLILRDHGWRVAVVCEDQRATVRISIPTVVR